MISQQDIAKLLSGVVGSSVDITECNINDFYAVIKCDIALSEAQKREAFDLGYVVEGFEMGDASYYIITPLRSEIDNSNSGAVTDSVNGTDDLARKILAGASCEVGGDRCYIAQNTFWFGGTPLLYLGKSSENNLRGIKDLLRRIQSLGVVQDDVQVGEDYNDGTYKGKVTKVEGNSITIASEDENGNEVSVEIIKDSSEGSYVASIDDITPTDIFNFIEEQSLIIEFDSEGGQVPSEVFGLFLARYFEITGEEVMSEEASHIGYATSDEDKTLAFNEICVYFNSNY